jgi:uncharacterized protein YcbX
VSRLSALLVYPLKSASGIEVEQSHVERRGLAGDRRWMVVDADGTFLSQRSRPRLALIGITQTADGLRLRAPDRPPVDVPAPTSDAERLEVTVWDDPVDAALAPPAAHDWLSDYLDADARLVYMPDDVRRPVDRDHAVQEDDTVSFADGYPLLLANAASLRNLNARLDAALPMNRFRPNVVVTGADPWAEDTWRRLRIGDVVFRAVKPCGRCSVTTVDQTSAEQGAEPLRTLAQFRRNPDTGKVDFGWNLIPETTGTVSVGDDVEVLKGAPGPAYTGVG